jgi:hypothetical protein
MGALRAPEEHPRRKTITPLLFNSIQSSQLFSKKDSSRRHSGSTTFPKKTLQEDIQGLLLSEKILFEKGTQGLLLFQKRLFKKMKPTSQLFVFVNSREEIKNVLFIIPFSTLVGRQSGNSPIPFLTLVGRQCGNTPIYKGNIYE